MAYQVFTSVLSGCCLAVVTWLAHRVTKQLDGFNTSWEVMKKSQRDQLKASIVRSYEEAREQGYIKATELDTLNRRAESYYALGGNNYIHAVVAQANAMEIRGEIPEMS